MEGVCSVCQKSKNVHFNYKIGALICPNCRRHDPSTHEKCSACEKTRPVVKRTDAGEPICNKCYQRHRRAQKIPHST